MMARRKGSTNEQQQRLSQLPRVDHVVAHGALEQVGRRLGSPALTGLARQVVQEARQAVRGGGQAPSLDDVAARVLALARDALGRRAGRVVNAAGVVVHTNLGRAPLLPSAAEALADTAGRYVSLEVDLKTGRRGPRAGFAEMALAQLTGAEDALVVNNNAAAVLLVLTALASGRSVVVSRGEQVEIGGGFRVPDVLARSGATMVEVGTTNRTRLADYEQALQEHEDVAVLLRVHQANFRQIGFVERPTLKALAGLARRHDVVLVKDLGGGAFVDLEPHGLTGEPTVVQCVAGGADLVCFSCDKVLGGPQGGAIVGRAELVQQARRDPLARAVRLGRLPQIALEATLAAYLSGSESEVPVLRALRTPLEQIRARVEGWCRALADRGVQATPMEVAAATGGGAFAQMPVPSVAAVLAAADPTALAAELRRAAIPVLARIHDDHVLLDGRTVLPDEDQLLLDAVVAAVAAVAAVEESTPPSAPTTTA